ncbi:MAG: polyamine aminopropyltransferase [Betaproteobacteria bacterium]|nr:polyamine aminopropyltransferase [Betaproteobacteria bacterium]
MRLEEKLTAASGVYFDGVLIDSLQTPFQLIEVFDTPDLGKLMRIDGANMVSERDEFFYHENLIHPAAIAHPAPREVLIIGGGDGGSLEEILKHREIERVVLAELDGGVIEMAKKHFSSVHRGAFVDPRVEIRIGDGMAFVRESGQRFDLIYLDLTDPIGPVEALYTQTFYADCKRALNPGGALVLHIGSPFSHAERVKSSMENLRGIFAKVTPWFVHIPMYGATWGFACASDYLDPHAFSSTEVDARLTNRNVGQRQFYNGDMHTAMLGLPEYVRAALG